MCMQTSLYVSRPTGEGLKGREGESWGDHSRERSERGRVEILGLSRGLLRGEMYGVLAASSAGPSSQRSFHQSGTQDTRTAQAQMAILNMYIGALKFCFWQGGNGFSPVMDAGRGHGGHGRSTRRRLSIDNGCPLIVHQPATANAKSQTQKERE